MTKSNYQQKLAIVGKRYQEAQDAQASLDEAVKAMDGARLSVNKGGKRITGRFEYMFYSSGFLVTSDGRKYQLIGEDVASATMAHN